MRKLKVEYHSALAAQLKLYEKPLTAIRELIVNSYDPDSKASIAEIMYKPNDKIPLIIRDNGIGINEYDLKTIGNPHKKYILTEDGRKPIGEKGVGRLSVLALTKKATVSSKRLNGTFEITDEAFETEISEISTDYYAQGTEWCFYKPLLEEKLTEESLRHYIIENLYGILGKVEFRIFLNGKPILPELPCPPERTSEVYLETKYKDKITFTYCIPMKEEESHFLCGKVFFSLKGITVQEYDFKGTGTLTGYIDIDSDEIPLQITRDKFVQNTRTDAIKRTVREYINKWIKIHREKIHELITKDSLEKIIQILDKAVKDLGLGRLYGEKIGSGEQKELKDFATPQEEKIQPIEKKEKKEKKDIVVDKREGRRRISSELGFDIQVEKRGPNVPALIYVEHSTPILVINTENIALKDLKQRTNLSIVNAQLCVLIPRKLLDGYVEQGRLQSYQKEPYLEKLMRNLQDEFLKRPTEDIISAFSERKKVSGKAKHIIDEKFKQLTETMQKTRDEEVETMRDN